MSGRVQVWEQYWESIMSDPMIFWFGTGLSEGAAFGWIEINLGLAHNPILDVWGLSGLTGLLFFLIFLVYVLTDLKRLLSFPPVCVRDQILAVSYAVAVLFFLQYLLVQAVTADRSFMIVFYLVAGMLKPLTKWLQINSKIRRARAHAIQLDTRVPGKKVGLG